MPPPQNVLEQLGEAVGSAFRVGEGVTVTRAGKGFRVKGSGFVRIPFSFPDSRSPPGVLSLGIEMSNGGGYGISTAAVAADEEVVGPFAQVDGRGKGTLRLKEFPPDRDQQFPVQINPWDPGKSHFLQVAHSGHNGTFMRATLLDSAQAKLGTVECHVPQMPDVPEGLWLRTWTPETDLLVTEAQVRLADPQAVDMVVMGVFAGATIPEEHLGVSALTEAAKKLGSRRQRFEWEPFYGLDATQGNVAAYLLETTAETGVVVLDGDIVQCGGSVYLAPPDVAKSPRRAAAVGVSLHEVLRQTAAAFDRSVVGVVPRGENAQAVPGLLSQVLGEPDNLRLVCNDAAAFQAACGELCAE